MAGLLGKPVPHTRSRSRRPSQGDHLKARSFGGGPRLGEKPRLSRPKAALGHEQPAGARAGGVHQVPNRRHLWLPL